MTKSTATRHENNSDLTGAAIGIVLLDAFLADPQAAEAKRGPEWIKVAPRGAFTARDGRKFSVDPEALTAQFTADAVDLPVDIDHSTTRKAIFGDPAPAVGWIKELQARTDGLYGRVEWLDEGLRILSARSHRYISPTLAGEGSKMWLHSAALVAAPAASMPAVASADLSATPEKPMLKAIAAALGLSEDAAETSCLSAIAGLKTRIDPAVHTEALNQVKTLSAELDGIKAETRKGKVDALLDDAVTRKKISPAQRASYELLCATDDGLVQVTKLIETLGAGLGPSGLDERRAPGDVATLSSEDRAVMRALDLSEEDYRKANGLTAA